MNGAASMLTGIFNVIGFRSALGGPKKGSMFYPCAKEFVEPADGGEALKMSKVKH